MQLFKKLFFIYFVLHVAALQATNRDSIEAKHLSPQRPNFIIKTSPFPIVWGVIPFTSEWRCIWEYTTAPKQSSQFSLSYLGKSPLFSIVEAYAAATSPAFDKFKFRGIRLQGWYKFYYSSHKYSPRGAYIAPHISWAFARVAPEKFMKTNRYLLARYLNMDLHWGYQFFIGEHFAVDVFMAYGYKYYRWYDHFTTSQYKPSGVLQTANNPPPAPNKDDPFRNINKPTRFQVGVNFGWGRK